MQLSKIDRIVAERFTLCYCTLLEFEHRRQRVNVYLAVRNAPSLWKDALSLGLVHGHLYDCDHGLRGVMRITRFGWAVRARIKELAYASTR